MKKILVIEDSQVFADIVSNYLKHELGIEPDIVNSRAAAIELLEQKRDDYFLAIIDLHLPDSMNGEIVKDTGHFNIPSIVLTGDMSQSLRKEILSHSNVCDYVLKNGPNALEYVAQTIQRLDLNQSTHVLVVDDSKLSRELLRTSLETQLLQVTTVNSAEDALTFVKDHSEIQLVIADGELEGMDGIQLTTELRRVKGLKELSIIGISGTYDKSKSIQFLKAGANDYISKPFQFEELNTRVNHNLSTLSQMAELKSATENQKMLLHIAAHDIRNPLANIVSLIGMIKRKPSSTEKCLGLIEMASRELLSLISSIVEFSRAKSGKLEIKRQTINSQVLLEEILPELKQMASDKNIELLFQHDKSEVGLDATLMRQVLKNLINNAIKFSPQQTTISINCQVIQSQWEATIADQGQGIPMAERNKLFKPFANLSVKPTGNEASSGLGLALCEQLVSVHNGEIGVRDNESGVGICFFVRLPLN